MAAPPLGLTARATVHRVIDGDTVVLSHPWPMTIRLKDCWAPELTGDDSEAGDDARLALVELLDPPCDVIVHIPTGDASSLTSIMSFGRPVAEIWRYGQERSVSEEMVNLGHATAEKVCRK